MNRRIPLFKIYWDEDWIKEVTEVIGVLCTGHQILKLKTSKEPSVST